MKLKFRLLFTTWNHIIPLAIIRSDYHVGDFIEVRGKYYYINCEPGQVSPSGEVIKHYYCVKAAEELAYAKESKP